MLIILKNTLQSISHITSYIIILQFLQVFFVDYGQTHIVEISDLLELPKYLLSIPFQVVFIIKDIVYLSFIYIYSNIE